MKMVIAVAMVIIFLIYVVTIPVGVIAELIATGRIGLNKKRDISKAWRVAEKCQAIVFINAMASLVLLIIILLM